jgi:hypothetical protein
MSSSEVEIAAEQFIWEALGLSPDDRKCLRQYAEAPRDRLEDQDIGFKMIFGHDTPPHLISRLLSRHRYQMSNVLMAKT